MRRPVMLFILALTLAACTQEVPGTAGSATGTGSAGSGSGGGTATSPATRPGTTSPLRSTAPGQAPATPAPGSTGSRNASAVTLEDVSGAWVFGDGTDPEAGAVSDCRPNQTLTLTHTGDRLQGSVGSCAGLCLQFERLDGTFIDGVATLSGTYKGNQDKIAQPVDYSLRYNPATQHFVGTRNGRPFWAAPHNTSGCAPSPTPSDEGDDWP